MVLLQKLCCVAYRPKEEAASLGLGRLLLTINFGVVWGLLVNLKQPLTAFRCFQIKHQWNILITKTSPTCFGPV